MRKLSHKTVVGTLRDINTEADANASSGDPRLAAEARRSSLLSTILLQIVSSIPEDDFNSVKLANYNKSEMREAAKDDDDINKHPENADEQN